MAKRPDNAERNRKNKYRGNLKHGKSRTPSYFLFHHAKQRAITKGIAFTLDLDDIVIPEFCPLLNIQLIRGIGKLQDNSPTLDRKDVTKGYTKENSWVVSYKANRSKNNLTREEANLLVFNWNNAVTIP